MGTHFGKVFWAIEAFFKFRLRTEIWGTPRGNPQDPKISKILFSKLQYFLAEVVPTKSILIELSITNLPLLHFGSWMEVPSCGMKLDYEHMTLKRLKLIENTENIAIGYSFLQ